MNTSRNEVKAGTPAEPKVERAGESASCVKASSLRAAFRMFICAACPRLSSLRARQASPTDVRTANGVSECNNEVTISPSPNPLDHPRHHHDLAAAPMRRMQTNHLAMAAPRQVGSSCGGHLIQPSSSSTSTATARKAFEHQGESPRLEHTGATKAQRARQWSEAQRAGESASLRSDKQFCAVHSQLLYAAASADSLATGLTSESLRTCAQRKK